MPNLPTLSVTDAQATRILAVFGDAATYKEWLKEQIRSHVLSTELSAFDTEHLEARRAKQEKITAELPEPAPPTPPVTPGPPA